ENAEKQYEKTVAEAIKQRDETGAISEEEAQKIIDAAKKQRDETITKAEERHKKIISTAKKQAGEHADLVDWETGQILSKWEVFKNKLSLGWENIKKITKHKWNQMWQEIDKVVEWIKTKPVEKFESMRKRAVDKFESLRKGIVDKMESARKAVKGKIDEIKGFFDRLTLKIPRPKIPKISLSKASKSIGGIDVPYPKFSFDGWYAKGGFFDRPSIIGVGEAGPEAVIPLQGSRMKPFAAE